MIGFMVDIVLTSYNRPDKVIALAKTLNSITGKRIIVVDSGDNDFSDYQFIKQISSSYKNQPYQRYVGYVFSSAEFIIYLDDDMEVIDTSFANEVIRIFKSSKEISAINLVWKNKPNVKQSLEFLPKTRVVPKGSFMDKMKKFLSFYPDPPVGQLGPCGIRGSFPEGNNLDSIQFLSGGAFAVRRSSLYRNFNFFLFSHYNKKMGRGEDSIMGITLTTVGKVVYLNHHYFWHNDDGYSHYLENEYENAKRYIFSRRYLSLERARILGGSLFFSDIYYILFSLFRIFPNVFRQIFLKDNKAKNSFKGGWEGLREALKYEFRYEDEKRWKSRALLDISKTITSRQ